MVSTGIADQLADGIRGLLIDTHYADRLADGKLRAYFGDRQALRRPAEHDGVSPDAVEAAERIRDRLGFYGEGSAASISATASASWAGRRSGPSSTTSATSSSPTPTK
jgi:hypothetical protein